jgi:MFS family permease
MEGLADATAAALKYVSGRWVDRGVRLKPLVVGGYVLASVARPLMGFATQPWQPIAIRVTDRVGKGLRTSPRDAMIARLSSEGARGRAFGFDRAMDNLGAALGALTALLLTALGIPLGHIFFWAGAPAALAVVAALLTQEPAGPSSRQADGRQEALPSRVWAYLVPVTLFGLGNSTDAFVLLKLSEQGAAPALLPVAWLILNGVKAAVSYPAGVVADRLSSARVVLTGWVLYALSYLLLAFATSVPATMVVIAFYGLYHAMSEGAEKALLVELVPGPARGRALGLYNGLGGGAVLLAGFAFGAVWTSYGSKTAFLGAAGVAGVSAFLLAVLLPRARPR